MPNDQLIDNQLDLKQNVILHIFILHCAITSADSVQSVLIGVAILNGAVCSRVLTAKRS